MDNMKFVTDDLKKAILQKAIQGKLVEQNPNDEPASELLKRIREEKEKLIRDGKIKKEKSLSPITDEEKPFDIPSSWEWVRLGNFVEVISGTSYDKSKITNNGIRIFRGGNLVGDRLKMLDDDVFLPKDEFYDKQKCISKNDIIIVASTGSITGVGRPAFCNEELSEEVQIGAFLRIVRLYDSSLFGYIKTIFSSQYRRNWISNSVAGIGIRNVKTEHITNLLIPLPPLEELKRIVAKLDELMLLLDEARPLEEEITKLEKDFPSKLRQSILKSAVKGELVSNSSFDELPDELLKKVKNEKERLIKEGKIKKGKPLEPITDEEKFLDLGGDCVWVRLGEIAMIDKGNTGIMKAIPGEYPMYTTAEQPITHNEYQIDGKAVMIPLVSSTGHGHASIKRLHYGEGKFAVGSILSTVQPYGDIVSAKYLYCYLSTFKERLLVSQMKGIANVTLSIDAIKNVVVPIPSTKNQEKLEELVKLCDELEEQINLS